MSRSLSLCFLLGILSVQVLHLSIYTILHWFLGMVVRQGPGFIFLHVDIQFSQHHLLLILPVWNSDSVTGATTVLCDSEDKRNMLNVKLLERGRNL